MEGWHLLFLIAICAWSGKQLPILNSLSSVIYWVVEANDFRRPITQDNISLAPCSRVCRTVFSKKRVHVSSQINQPFLLYSFLFFSYSLQSLDDTHARFHFTSFVFHLTSFWEMSDMQFIL